MKVKDVMTPEVITAREDLTRQQAAQLLSQHRISGLPVVKDDNVLVGLVTVSRLVTSRYCTSVLHRAC